MALTIRPARPEEIPSFSETLGLSFGFDSNAENLEHFEQLLELDRTRCAFDGSSLVGTSGVYSLDLTVPGGSLPTAGTTLIAVRPTHRRQGMLRAMMAARIVG